MLSLSDHAVSPLAGVLVLLYGALMASDFPLAAANGTQNVAVGLLIVGPYAPVGGLIASRQPRNPIGWLDLLGAVRDTVQPAHAGVWLGVRA